MYVTNIYIIKLIFCYKYVKRHRALVAINFQCITLFSDLILLILTKYSYDLSSSLSNVYIFVYIILTLIIIIFL